MTKTPEELGKKIREARERQARDNPKKESPAASGKENPGVGQAMRAATDLVAALLVGGFLGYWIDQWLGTKPWAMLILFFLGFAAGFLNIYRAQMGQSYQVGFKEPPPSDKTAEPTPSDKTENATPENDPAGKKEE